MESIVGLRGVCGLLEPDDAVLQSIHMSSKGSDSAVIGIQSVMIYERRGGCHLSYFAMAVLGSLAIWLKPFGRVIHRDTLDGLRIVSTVDWMASFLAASACGEDAIAFQFSASTF